MNKFELLALLGALAWLPPLIQLIIWLFTKPKLTIITHRQMEIGHNINGPIFNLSIALSGSTKECLVTEITVELKGPNEEKHILNWQWFEEKLYEIDYSELGLTPVKKQQNAIAIKVLKENLVEKKIGFHETLYKAKYDENYSATNQKSELISKANQDIQTLKASNEYDSFKTLFENSMIWKEGAYVAKIIVTVLNHKKTFSKEIKFHLTASHINKMQSNIPLCLAILEKHYFPVEEDEESEVLWSWIYPNIME